MSSKSTSNKTKFKKHCDWAFDFRTQFASSSDDSQSGSESNDQELATGASRLPIDDLDLSTREEHVTYKPNPFSIAKINAAHRPASTVNNLVLQPTQPTRRPPDKPTRTRKLTRSSHPDSGQTTILEGFKTQARTKPSALRPATNPLSLKPNLAVNNPASEKPVVSVSPAKSTLSTATLLSASAVLTSPRSNSVPNPLEYAHTLHPTASQRHDAHMLSRISQSSALAPARFLPDMLRNQRKRTNVCRPFFSSFSSPDPRYNDGPLDPDPRILYSQPYSSPIQQPVRQGPFHPYSMVSLQEPSSLIKDQSNHSEEAELVDDYVGQANENPSGFLRHSPILPSSSNFLHQAKPLNQRQRAGARPADLSPSPLLRSGTPPNLYLARRRIPDDSSTSSKQAKSYPKRDAYQYPTGDPDEDWTTLPSKKKKKSNIAVPRNYTYTESFHIPGLRLPPAVKTETKIISPARRVKMYLPPPPNSVDVRCSKADKNFGSKRTEPSMKEPEDGRHVASSSSPPNFDASLYPSPSASKSRLSPSFLSQANKSRGHTPSRSRRGDTAVASYRPPSPPTSDLPIPSEAMDIQLEVDHQGIQLRYPEMKRLSRKRRRLSAEVWNLLGVDSCGYVWRDHDDGGRSSEEAEIQIVVWNGLPQPFA